MNVVVVFGRETAWVSIIFAMDDELDVGSQQAKLAG